MRPLEDVRIVAVEQYGAGPWGSLHLADLGAEVIKIEDPRGGGDVGRYVPPFQEGSDSLFFETFNRGKRSLQLDITTPAGRAVLEDLVRVSDAVYANLRGDVPAKLRLRYQDLKEVNPRVVCCFLSAYGMTGPRAAEPGYDYIIQGLTGWMTLTGEPDGPPTRTGPSLVDYSGGFAAAIALLAGLHAARRDGVGMDCDVSLFDVATALVAYPSTWYLTGGLEPSRTRHSAHPSLVPFQSFQTADGWIVIGCAKEKFFQRLVAALGLGELAGDERFADFAARRRNAGELLAILEPAMRARPSAELLAELTAAGVPCGPVNDLPAALADPHTRARELIAETEHPRFGTVRQVGAIAKVGEQPPAYRRAPLPGEDAAALLGGLLGYDDGKVRDLTAAGAFGNLPCGEGFIAPAAGDGAVVASSFAAIGLGEARLTVTGGRLTEASGAEGQRLYERLIAHGEAGTNLAELGVGTNENARLTGIVLEDEKILGTVHVAFGASAGIGGTVAVPIHLDVVITNASLTIGDTAVLEDGRYLL